jgi:hypothetical protein
MMEESPGPKKLLHVVIGTSDRDNCPICRAHAQAEVDQGIDGADIPIRVQELHLSEVLRCPCPLCTQARQDAL